MAKRENGSGTIRTVKGANGTRYYAYAPATYEKVDGKRKCIRQRLGVFPKKSEAKAALEKFRDSPSLKVNFTPTQVYTEWSSVAFPDISSQTQGNYKAAWTQICEAWGDKVNQPIREITTADIRAVYDYWMEPHEVVRKGRGKAYTRMSKPLSKSSMQKIKALLVQMYTYCESNNITAKNYARLVKIPKDAAEGSVRAFTDLEFAKLSKNWEIVPGGDVCLVLCYTGFRITEFCELTVFSYDPKEKTLRGGIKTEAGKDRIVPVHPKIIPIIEGWCKSSKGILYTKPNGKPYTKDSFRKAVWNPCMEALGLPDDLTPHSARHTFGTMMAAAGARAEDIKAIMGHSDFSVTANTYINQDVSTLKQAVGMIK